MNKKILSCIIIGVLASWAGSALSNNSPVLSNQIDGGVLVDDNTGLSLEIQGRGSSESVTESTSADSTKEELQPDRRATISLQNMSKKAEDVGEATVTGRFTMELPDGGLVWATEDPNIGEASLTVSAPSYVGYDNQRIVKAVKFYLRSNYAAFVDRYELLIYKGDDSSLSNAIVKLDVPVATVADFEWDGVIPQQYRLSVGRDIQYVLRAYDSFGNYDETYASKIQLLSPERAEKGYQTLQDDVLKSTGLKLSKQEALSKSLLDNVLVDNGIRKRSIVLAGSRMKIRGSNLVSGSSIKINNESVFIDKKGDFLSEYIVPVGVTQFNIQAKVAGIQTQKKFNFSVSAEHTFLVALADLTISKSKTSGVSKSLATQKGDDSALAEGRLAFYMKKKMKGNLTITAQADTKEKEIKKLFKGFTVIETADLFKTITTPDFYPIYGDGSTVYSDVGSMGRFYFRGDWNNSQLIFGNFNTDLTGTQYSSYSRFLYGAGLSFNSVNSTKWGESNTIARGFASQEQTAPVHVEFLGTGISNYYLKHMNIIPYTDKVAVEVRDEATGLVISRKNLVRGADYKINPIQGKLELTNPLQQRVESDNRITRDSAVGGYENRLVVDYEYVPTDFKAENVSYGTRAKHWFGDHVALGGTYVKEKNAGANLEIKGIDLTLQAGNSTYLKAEFAKTRSFGNASFYSIDGGNSFKSISFTDKTLTEKKHGTAKAVEARVDLREIGLVEKDVSVAAWWNKEDSGYSTLGSKTDTDTTRYGVEVKANVTDDVSVYARVAQRKLGEDKYTETQLTGQLKLSDKIRLSMELRQDASKVAMVNSKGIVTAARVDSQLSDNVDVYAIAQASLKNQQNYDKNNMATLGGKYRFTDKSSLGAEVSKGNRGSAVQLNAEHQFTPDYSVYTGYTVADNRTNGAAQTLPSRDRTLNLGQRLRVTNNLSVNSEASYMKSSSEHGLTNNVGADYSIENGWRTGVSLQKGDVSKTDVSGKIKRLAISAYLGRATDDLDWTSSLELRKDSGAQNAKQIVSSNSINYTINDELSLASQLNLSKTTNKSSVMDGAKYIDASLGFAYRPTNNTDFSLFGRYNFNYDMAPAQQENGSNSDKRIHVLSVEGVYRIAKDWELAAKLARRDGSNRMGRASGKWYDSAATFAAAQLRYDLLYQWHALAEIRALKVKKGGIKSGMLVAVDKDINKYFSIGVGYNFTNFSEDLTNIDYKYHGVFVNISGQF